MRIIVREVIGAAQNDAMDPIVVALAQLVRDRWENERKARVARRRGLILIGAKSR